MTPTPSLDPDATVVRAPAFAQADPDATVVRPAAGRRAGARAQPPQDPDATVILPRRGAVIPQPPAPAAGPRLPLPRLPKAPPLALPAGTELGEYRIERVLGQGGFGITYLATDRHLDAPVAIKEYLPEEIAFRAGDRSVSPNATRHADRYREGLDSFLAEARTLAALRHPAIVRVARFFEAHRTAYMVLEYERGQPLKTWWPRQQGPGEAGLVELLLPLLDGLAAVHAAGFLHRDIKPDNIQVREHDGSLVLLDFGSAGQTVAVAEQGSVVVTPGYAPIEQYGLGEQGAWTDLHALAATLYWCVAGRKPPDAETRAADPRALTPALEAGRGRFGDAFLKAIDRALDMDPARRPRDVAEFRRELCADHLARLDLHEALQQGDSMLEPAAPGGERPAVRHLAWRPRDWPLALKMTLAMVATALLPMLLAGAYNLSGSLDAVADAELRLVRQLAHSTAGRIGQFVDDSRLLTRALATDADFPAFLQRPDDATRDALRDKLQRQVRANPNVQLIMLMDGAGNALVSSDAEVQGRNFAFRHYFREAMAGRAHTTGIVVGAVAGAAGLFFAEPVRADDGQVIGAMVLRVLGSAVGDILDEVRHDSTLTPLLVDGDGVVIQHPREDLLYRSLAPLPEATQAAMRADQRFRRDRVDALGETALAQAVVGAKAVGDLAFRSALSGRDEIAGYAPVPGHDWVVVVSEPRTVFEAPLRQLYSHLLWSVVLVGLLFTGLALRFARSIVRPVRALTDAAGALKAGDYDGAHVPVQGRDELGRLARTFNVMVEVLRQRDRDRERG
ncbi:MAG: HAMP domain-containing protein [Rubrivivax sp.]|nr:HAMP domain-containing protein [Rubrivivax sp.]